MSTSERAEIMGAIQRGIVAANTAYTRMSGGLWISDSGVESFLATHVAHQVFDAARTSYADAFVTLETSFSEIADASGARAKRGRPLKVFEGRPQVDLVLWHGDVPVVAIELKRHANWTGVDGDIERVAALVDAYGPRQGGTLESGVVGFFIARGADPDLTKMQAYYAEVEEIIADWRPDGYAISRIEPALADTSLVDAGYADYSLGGLIIAVF